MLAALPDKCDLFPGFSLVPRLMQRPHVAFRLIVNLRRDRIFATAARKVKPMAPAEDFEPAVQALPQLDRCHAGAIERAAQRLDHALGVGAALELRHVIGQVDVVDRRFDDRFATGDLVLRQRGIVWPNGIGGS